MGDDLTFADYLDSHFPLGKRQSPLLWITLADSLFADTGAANLHTFVEQLNSERRTRYFGWKPDTKLVVLCLDENCVQKCAERGMYAYGGYERTRPEQILRATWPKIAAFMEILPSRSLFFIDADVSFALDPYPHLEPLMKRFDILAQENDAFEHFNTGWMWLRKGHKVAEAWREVFEMDMRSTSRDQYNFNDVLDSGPRRLHDEGDKGRRPLKSDFVAKNGLRVHVLDTRLFRVYHQRVNDYVARHDSMQLHMTCADDASVKLFVPKVEGFWSDVDAYYSRPPTLISVDVLSGTQADLAQLFRILLAAAHYSSRALILPESATVTDLLDSSPTAIRAAHSTFPLSQLAMPDSPLGVRVLEPRYVEHAAAHLLGKSVLDSARRREDGWWDGLGAGEQVRRLGKVVELAKVVDLVFHSAPHVRLMNIDWPDAQHWRHYDLPEPVRQVKPCHKMEELQTCDNVCRFEGDEREIRVDGGWPDVRDIMAG
ncbi:hypothetical protein Rhopal_000429-T1 [Rhodotorula paludigena]|uniref:Nucleotide-diphospho-sugar transferase domain-containing protein n=1 Tax=Rhodotorula paludigena TaxID=86838 RepID=A0AAV5GCV4_9BASI|nr:hypothetical protein Rhopal_000429-T1 [Rhodotorula paludigena]